MILLSKLWLQYLKSHKLVFLYILTIVWLSIGLLATSGITYLHFLVVHVVALILFYILINRFLGWIPVACPVWLFFKQKKNWQQGDFLGYAILALVTIIVFWHWMSIGFIPIFKVVQSIDFLEIRDIRQGLEKVNYPIILRYGISIALKAILPFLLLYFHVTRKKIAFIITLVLGIIYAVSLLQKSFIVLLFIPLLVALLYQRKIWKALSVIVFVVAAISFLVVITNPQVFSKRYKNIDPERRNQIESVLVKKPENFSRKSKVEVVSEALISRVFIVPGKMVSKWFEIIPKEFPYLKGAGYSFIAPLTGKPFVDCGKALYPYVYPDYSAHGLSGTVNTAHFMYDYANWGWPGLLISALLLALWLFFINKVFAGFPLLELSLNLYPLIALSFSAFSTNLLSGGWIILIVLFLLFKKQLAQHC